MDAGNLGPEKLNVRIYFALKVEFKGKYGGAKTNDVGCNGSISSLNGCVDKLVELVVIDAFQISVVGCMRTASVMSLPVNLEENGFGGSFFCPNDGLTHLAGAVSLVLCVHMCRDERQCSDSGRAGGLGCCT